MKNLFEMFPDLPWPRVSARTLNVQFQARQQDIGAARRRVLEATHAVTLVQRRTAATIAAGQRRRRP